MQQAKWQVIVDTKNGISNLNKFASSQDKVTSSMKSTAFQGGLLNKGMGSLQSAVLRLAGGVGLLLLAKSFLGVAKEMEGYRSRLTVLLRSQSEGNKLFERMAALAMKVPAELKDMMNAATTLATSVRGGADEIMKWMPMIVDFSSATREPLEEVAQQFRKMFSSGAQAARTFRVKGYLEMLGFKDGVSYTAAETKKILMDMYNSPSSNIKGASALLAKDFSGVISMLQDHWMNFRKLFMDSRVFAAITLGLQKINDYLDKLKSSGKLEKFANDMATSFLKGVQYVAVGAAKLIDIIAPLFSLVISESRRVLTEFSTFPKIFQELGVLGVLLFGVKGLLIEGAITGALALYDKTLNDAGKRLPKLNDQLNENLALLAYYTVEKNKLIEEASKDPKGGLLPVTQGPIHDVDMNLQNVTARIKGLQETIKKLNSGEKISLLDMFAPTGKEDSSMADLLGKLLDFDSSKAKTHYSEDIQKFFDEVFNMKVSTKEDVPLIINQIYGLLPEQRDLMILKTKALAGDLLAIRKLAEIQEIEAARQFFEEKQTEYEDAGQKEVDLSEYIEQTILAIKSKNKEKELMSRAYVNSKLLQLDYDLAGNKKALAEESKEREKRDFIQRGDEITNLMKEQGYTREEIEQYQQLRLFQIDKDFNEKRKADARQTWLSLMDYGAQAFGQLGGLFDEYYSKRTNYERNLQQQISNEQEKGNAEEASRLERKLKASQQASRKAFILSRNFRFIEAMVSTASAVIKALAEPALPFPANAAWASTVGVIGAAKAGMIAAEQPPSYSGGGIFEGPRTGKTAILHGKEAVIPIPSGEIPLLLNSSNSLVVPFRGGAVPVKFYGKGNIASDGGTRIPSFGDGGFSLSPQLAYVGERPEAHIPLNKLGSGSSGNNVTILMENPVFQDLETQQKTFAIIAEKVSRAVSPVAVVDNFRNDGIVRTVLGKR
jgi:hypothetical protein